MKRFLMLAGVLTLGGIARAKEPKPLSIATSSASVPAAAARLAKERHGLKATVTPMDNGSMAAAGQMSGSNDFVTTDRLTPAALMFP